MKILPIEKVRKADSYTIENEPVKSIDLMERAATQCFKWIKKRAGKSKKYRIIAGPGNNGGDGLVVARLLADKGCQVEVVILRFTDKESDDFSINLKRIKDDQQVSIKELQKDDQLDITGEETVIIDAIFGSGLSKPVKGFIGDMVKTINSSNSITIAIDMPSGLFADKTSLGTKSIIVKADYTLSFQFPKYCFFFPENDKYIGEWHILPIGLHSDFINSVEVKDFYLEKSEIKELIKTRNKFSHKGNYGHGLLISGSYGKMGAAVLASRSAMRAGIGLVTTHVPKKGYDIIQTSVPENMVSIDSSEVSFSEVPDLSGYSAIAVGPGLGKEKETQQSLKLLIQNTQVPIIFDADAINILAENKTWISFVPKGSIFTPHPKEFERLIGKWSNEFERNKLQREFSFKYQSYVVLKGAHTAITTPDGQCYFNSTGNPGMATGGSGDVLTGILLGLLAQNYTPLVTSLIGVYMHGLAADLAAQKLGEEAMIAGDIVAYLGKAFKKLHTT